MAKKRVRKKASSRRLNVGYFVDNFMKKRNIDYDMPIGSLKRIPDFLPPPGELGIRDELNDPKLLKRIAEGRRAIRKGARGILLSNSVKKYKQFRSNLA